MRNIILAAAATVACSSAAFAGNVGGFNGWGVHGGSVTVNSDGSITGNHGDSELDTPKYHWNKSSWDGRNGRKAFYSTSELNGRPVSDILSIDYTVTDSSAPGARTDVYFNIMVQDAGGARAILAPRYLDGTSSGFSRDGTAGPLGDFSVFEAEAGWTGPTGSGSAEFDDIKDFIISSRPKTELPDTLTGDATSQTDPVYQYSNWADWADQSGGTNSGWELDGVMLAFGQSTGTPEVSFTTVSDFGVTVVPEPVAAMGGLSLLTLIGLRRRQSTVA
jgi:hypothetical protein